jgi:peroxiredoxin
MKCFKRNISLVLFLFLSIYSCERNGEQLSAEPTKQVAPSFSLTDLSGNTVSLNALQGKVVIINFFATWCGACRTEIPKFVYLYKKYNPQGIEMIGVSLDRNEPKLLKRFLKKYHVQYPVVFATRDMLYKYGSFSAIPATVIVNREGMIDQMIVGGRSKDVFEKMVARLLKDHG